MPATSSDNTPRSLLNGAYTDAQRKSGMALFLKQCSSCHGEQLRGGESAPALRGADFRMRWHGLTLADLMQKVMVMPPNSSGELAPEENASLIAVILAFNGFPSGRVALPSGINQLRQIHFE
jgi:mono/diheme cytochrome c family protein